MKISTMTGDIAVRLGTDEAAIRALAEAGFQACDFSMWNPPWHEGLWDEPDAAFDAYFSRLGRVAAECGVEVYQTHGPFPTTDGTPDEDAHRMRVMARAIRATALMGCRHIVIHPAKHMDGMPDPGFAAARAYNVAMFQSFEPHLREAGVRVALENMFGVDAQHNVVRSYLSTAEEMLALRAALDPSLFCFCLDLGHALLVDESPSAMIRALGDGLSVLHVHDNDGKRDLHTLPYLGIADWDEVTRALREAGYAGTLNLEADTFIKVFPEGMEPDALRMMAATARRLADMATA